MARSTCRMGRAECKVKIYYLLLICDSLMREVEIFYFKIEILRYCWIHGILFHVAELILC
jgi:hypothetical protein